MFALILKRSIKYIYSETFDIFQNFQSKMSEENEGLSNDVLKALREQLLGELEDLKDEVEIKKYEL